MDRNNKIMWAIYWAMFIVVSVATVLYCAVEKVRDWINLHVVFPYVRGCERLEEKYVDWCEKEESESDEE